MNGSVPPHGERAGGADADRRTGRDSGWPSTVSPPPTPEVAAEAAVWIARLHGPDRSVQMERACLAWQSRSDMHRLAFERCTEVWEAVPGLSLADAYSAASRAQLEPESRGLTDESDRDWDGGTSRVVERSRWVWGGIALGVFALGALSVFALINAGRDAPHYATGVGEQRSVVLADGSRLSLNTSTEVDVSLTPERRTVRIVSGEAFFEVAKDASRPFVVQALGSEVVALGTAFSVRLSEPGASARGLAVTLIEGRVNVRAGKASSEDAAVAPPKELTLVPGERVRLVKGGAAAKGKGSARSPAGFSSVGAPAVVTLDRPRIDQVTAWKRSEVVFDDVSLPEAVTEMNRYNREPIVLVGDAALSRLRVSGSYRAGDSDGFAHAAAALHGLHMRRADGRFELLRPQ